MNLTISGHHLDVTPAIREYVMNKLERITRHFDHVIDVTVILSVEKLRQKAEINVHVRGKDIHVESVDRQVCKHKERVQDHARGDALKYQQPSM
jgi:putative sigma-54 modulation protein